jgi:hypothetical protein
MDAGTDAGTNTGTDAGTDAGVACTDLPHDPKLGTLQLQTGFAAAESAALPEGVVEVTAVQSGSNYKLYGLRGLEGSLYELGTWPDLALGATALQATIPEEERSATTYLSGHFSNDGTRLLSGYTKAGGGFPGKVLVHDTAATSSTYLSAPGNYTSAGVSGGFLLNGTGLEGVAEGGAAVYALKTGSTPYQTSKLATFPEAGVSSGFTAVASNGVAVLGYSKFNLENFTNTNKLRAVAPAVYTPAFTSGTTLALSDTNAPEIHASIELFSIAGFGNGVALHRGFYDTSFNAFTRDVSRIELAVNALNPASVTAGALTSVLTTPNTCTNVVSMTPMGADLLVGVKDKNGRRLVRLQKQSP